MSGFDWPHYDDPAWRRESATVGINARASLICPVCHEHKRARHDVACWDCAPMVPPDTPGAQPVVWMVEIGDGMATGVVS